MYLYGKNQVNERIQARPQSIKKILLTGKSDAAALRETARSRGISCLIISEREFAALAGHHHAQGVIAEVEEFSYTDLYDLINVPDKEKYVFIALSNVTDPQNVGSILRTAACFGRFALIIPKHRSAAINETVLKVACGGENYVPVAQETNLIPALEQLKQAGYWVVGSVVDGGEDLSRFTFPVPLCFVVGSEDEGIRQGILSQLDYRVTLPMPGKDLSLNAAVATAIFCYEIMKQRRMPG
ncbi:MAG: 23S rRNA (guanosine(2251)-2'-O)-methyltransferase RlmB [Candidatus Omnitrophica bacterium]|nr:23S rRNA (guanosine(2251)-2'-O)-methyltransferase RlmB [Candidatus Omnitrophota bacterium]